ncbi:MAG: hypothetical protein NVSMB32_01200 [Actinomycetota bacterium]
MEPTGQVRAFLANLRRGDMPTATWLRKFARNRWRAMVLLKGCCGHPGEPGC